MNDTGREVGDLTFSLEPGCHRRVIDHLLDRAREAGLAVVQPEDLRLIVEEVLTNVVKYSGAADRGAQGRVRWRMESQRLELGFEDPGQAFDPLAVDAGDPPSRERCDGGMGILLIRSLADTIVYRREDGWNRLDLIITGP